MRVGAAPVLGAANDALIKLLATALNVRSADVRLVSGARSRLKILEIDGLSGDEIRERVRAP